jgi:outer membrane protein OmpA-like peptidoglycan-associated protein
MRFNPRNCIPSWRAAWFVPAMALLALAALPSVSAQSLADRLKGVQSGHEGPPPPALPVWKPVSANTSKMTIPLVKGLVVAGAQVSDRGDAEQIRTIMDTNPKAVTLVVEWDAAKGSAGSSTQPPQRRISTRVVDTADLAAAHRFMVYFHIGQTEHYPGSTGFGTSAEVINQLRTGQPSEMDFEANPDPIMTMMADRTKLIGWNGFPLNKCALQRVGTTDVAIPMLVNGDRVELPAIHAMCPVGGNEDAHFYFLDQPSNPILLDTLYSDGRSQMIKIDFPLNTPAQSSGMEQALAEKKPVEIYGIYFDFNSATIKPESEAVLKQIADIMTKNPAWKLSVSGHTDNIGDNSSNQALSEKRAAAVKNELVARFNIAADRLTTGGYGASRPIETNSTVEGRARNRRVELQRQ